MRFRTAITTALSAIMTTTVAAACGSDLTTSSTGDSSNPTQGSTVTALDTVLDAGGATRIEVKLFPGQLVARELAVETNDDEEKLVSQVTSIDPAQGTVTLALGGLVVDYGDDTRFRTEGESHQSRGLWEAAIQGELAAGRQPLVEARRNPAGAAQSPDDGSFRARDLRIERDNDDGHPKVEIYVDHDNLVSVSGGSLAVLRVLGLSIEVNGSTRLGDDNGQGDDDGGNDGNDDGFDD